MTLFEDPLGAFRFVVVLDDALMWMPASLGVTVPSLATASFQEVRGLSGELEVTPYAEGGRNDSLHQLPVRHSWGRLTLKRGLVRDQALWGWYQAGLHGALGARRNGTIFGLSELGLPAVAWVFTAGMAVKWSGPELNAMQGGPALESLEIAHEGLEQIVLLPAVVAP
jgi:phage tail-like protein